MIAGRHRQFPSATNRAGHSRHRALPDSASVSRTVAPDHADPTDESVGYYQSSAAPTFWAKLRLLMSMRYLPGIMPLEKQKIRISTLKEHNNADDLRAWPIIFSAL